MISAWLCRYAYKNPATSHTVCTMSVVSCSLLDVLFNVCRAVVLFFLVCLDLTRVSFFLDLFSVNSFGLGLEFCCRKDFCSLRATPLSQKILNNYFQIVYAENKTLLQYSSLLAVCLTIVNRTALFVTVISTVVFVITLVDSGNAFAIATSPLFVVTVICSGEKTYRNAM